MFDSIEMTKSARATMTLAAGLAAAFEDEKTSTEHLLLALVNATEDTGQPALSVRMMAACNLGVTDIGELMEGRTIRCILSPGGLQHVESPPEFDAACVRAVEHAVNETRLTFGGDVVGVEHLLVGVAMEPNGLAGRFLAKRGADFVTLRKLSVRLADQLVAV